MRFAITIALIVLNTTALAATNVTEAVCSTNVVPVKVSKKTPNPLRPQCEATTLSGNRCKRHAADGSKYCSQHAAIFRKREKKPEVTKSGRENIRQSSQ